jgi:hypothetical protein
MLSMKWPILIVDNGKGMHLREKRFVGLALYRNTLKVLGGNSQNFLGKFVRFLVTLGLKILRLFRLKVLFEANIING